jgi:hypothetical protein
LVEAASENEGVDVVQAIPKLQAHRTFVIVKEIEPLGNPPRNSAVSTHQRESLQSLMMTTGSKEPLQISLAYLKDLPLYEKEKPYEIWMQVPDDIPRTNCEFYEVKDIPLHDVRNLYLGDFDLETTGFKYLSHETQYLPDPKIFQQPGQEDSVAPYLAETAQLVKEVMNARKVMTYDWRVSIPAMVDRCLH